MFQSICDGSNIAASLNYSIDEDTPPKKQHESNHSLKQSHNTYKPNISVSSLKQAQKKSFNM
jgi:hypothetical protein